MVIRKIYNKNVDLELIPSSAQRRLSSASVEYLLKFKKQLCLNF